MNKFQCVDFISVNLKNILSEMPGVGIGEVMYFFSKYLFEHYYDEDPVLMDNGTLVNAFREFMADTYEIYPTEVRND